MTQTLRVTTALALVLGSAGLALAQAPGLTTGHQTSPADCTPVSVSIPGATKVEVTCEPGSAPLVAVEHLEVAPMTPLAPIVVLTEGTEVRLTAPDSSASAPIPVEGEVQ